MFQLPTTLHARNKVTITEKRAIMKYEYKKVTGYDQKRFIENGHTMFEEDVLQRLKRLAYLEEQLKQANGVNTEQKALHIGGVTPRFCFVCGTKLEEVGLGWMQCKSEKCGEVFLPFKDVDGNQNLMLQNTPFTPNEG